MVAFCRRPKGGLVTPFGLAFLTFIVVPSAIGSQDLAALVARQPDLRRSLADKLAAFEETLQFARAAGARFATLAEAAATVGPDPSP